MNTQGYAELNPSLNYTRAMPYSTLDGNLYNNTDKFQVGSNDNYTKTATKYYKGGVSTMVLKHDINDTPVSIMYFSPKNIKRIQKKIRTRVTELSKGTFSLDVDQDEQDLVIVMRAIYLEYGKNLDTHIVSQVKELNTITVNAIMPDLMTNIKQSYAYQKDITQPLQPIMRPTNMSHAGRKTLPSVTTLWTQF